MVGIHTYHNKDSFTPNESRGKSENDQRDKTSNIKVNLAFAFAFARCECVLTLWNRFLVTNVNGIPCYE